MFNKLLIISGPTATGKTSLAVKIAKKYKGELVSGDSCQIYRGMDIGTGKDQPKGTIIHLIDIISPDQKFSVADYQKIGRKTIEKIQLQGKLPILVGCSGFYIDSLINPNYNTFSVKPNKYLRIILNKFSVKSLQKIYKLIDKKGYLSLNHSDINNHYRLVRKIEIKLFSRNIKKINSEVLNYDILHISLTAPLDILYQRIDARVEKRIKIGFLNEVEKLLKKFSWSDPGMQIAAYQSLKPYFNQQPSLVFKKNSLDQIKESKVLQECLQSWSYAEHSDARRQACWFKTKSKTILFDITNENYEKKINALVAKWYNKL